MHFCLFVACFGSQLLNCLIAEDVAGESASDRAVGDVGILPIEWVVDIADKDNDWFIATAYTYNGRLRHVWSISLSHARRESRQLCLQCREIYWATSTNDGSSLGCSNASTLKYS